jgi:Uma2 family endonuclease
MNLPETVQFHKITVQEFQALYPYLDPNRPHELLEGQILVLPIPGQPHRVVRNHLYQTFFRQGCPGLHIWPGGLRLSEITELWPDLTLLGRDPDRRGPDNPSAADARLVVEVAYETLGLDTGAKARAYQQAGVPEYWIIDVQGRRVLRHLAPDYRSQTFAGSAPEGLLNAPSAPSLSPQAYPDVSIDVGALFTGS